MASTPVADLLFPYTRKMSGIRRYSEKLIDALARIGTPVKVHRIRKIEVSIGGKPAGGLISQRFFSLFARTRTGVLHSLSPDVVTGRTTVATIHDLIPFHNREVFMRTRRERLGYRIMFGRIDELTLIVQTESVKSQLVDYGIDPSKIEVCGASIQTLFKPSDRVSPFPADGRKHLITVGDYNPRKRFDVLYNAVNSLEDIDLYHIGPINNWTTRYMELRDLAQAKSRIHMLGGLSDEMLVDYLTHADLFVYASEAEGTGYTPAESMACGTLAVVNDIPSFRELYGHDVLYSDLTAEAFASAIENALRHPADKGKLLKAARKFSPDEEARKVAEVYNRVGMADK